MSTDSYIYKYNYDSFYLSVAFITYYWLFMYMYVTYSIVCWLFLYLYGSVTL